MRARGIGFDRTEVGDRNVLERLKEKGWLLGGEPSGHVICLDRNTTGDGIVAALQVLFAVVDRGAPLAELRKSFRKYPQRFENVKIMPPVAAVVDLPEVRNVIRDAEDELGSGGRIVLRPSGTEPLVRVMVEGAEEKKVGDLASRIAEALESALHTAAAGLRQPD